MYNQIRKEFWAMKEAEDKRLARLEGWERVSNFRFPEVLRSR